MSKRQNYIFRAKYELSDQWILGGGVWKFEREVVMLCEDRQGGPILKPIRGETVGQYVGIVDCQARRIFEGDVLVWVRTEQPDVKHVVEKYSDGCFGMGGLSFREIFDSGFYQPGVGKSGFRIIGNIIDNPKLKEKL